MISKILKVLFISGILTTWAGSAHAIVNGKTTYEPWAVAVTIEFSDVMRNCSGVVVGPQHVLTARHCFSELPEGFRGYTYNYYSKITISNGAYREANVLDYADTAYVPRCDNSGSSDAPICNGQGAEGLDFVVLKTMSKLKVPPIPLLSHPPTPGTVSRFTGKTLKVLGYSDNRKSDTFADDLLRYGLFTMNGYKRLYRIDSFGSTLMLGFGVNADQGATTYTADSGGPAVIQSSSGQWQLAGVLSAGEHGGSILSFFQRSYVDNIICGPGMEYLGQYDGIRLAGGDVVRVETDGTVCRPRNGSRLSRTALLIPNGGILLSRNETVASGVQTVVFRRAESRAAGAPGYGPSTTGLTVLENGSLVRLDQSGYVDLYRVSSGWTRLDSSPDSKRRIFSDGRSIYELNAGGTISQWIGGSWLRLGSDAGTFTVAAEQRSGGSLYRINGSKSEGDWKFIEKRDPACRGSGCWQSIGYSRYAVQIAADSQGPVSFEIRNASPAFSYVKSLGINASVLLDDNFSTERLVTGENGLFQIHPNGQVWKSTGRGFHSWSRAGFAKKATGLFGRSSDLRDPESYQLHLDTIVIEGEIIGGSSSGPIL